MSEADYDRFEELRSFYGCLLPDYDGKLPVASGPRVRQAPAWRRPSTRPALRRRRPKEAILSRVLFGTVSQYSFVRPGCAAG